MSERPKASSESGSLPVVYSKPNCPLCDHLKDELGRRGIRYYERNIVSSVEWFDRYQHRIPVILTAGGRELDPPFSEEDYRLLSGESG